MHASAAIIAALLAASSGQATDASAEQPTRSASACPAVAGQPPDSSAPIQRVGRLGVGGAVLAGAGLAPAIAGVILLSRGEVLVSNPRSSTLIFTDYRPQGRVLLGIGASAVALGTTALVVDIAVRSKRRRALAVAPNLNPHAATVTFAGRF